MTKVAIFDYGAGNIFSLKNSLQREGAVVDIISDFRDDNIVKNFDGLLLPGVGNFDPAMKSVTKTSQNDFVNYVKDTIPVLGICLGMEMFFAKSQEGRQSGLNVLDGEVVILPDTIKVPHMGWNSLLIRNSDSLLLEGVKNESWVYFVHSYMAKMHTSSSDFIVDNSGIIHTDVITSESDYNGIKIPASVEYKNYFGTQFHPEKSGLVGRQMIRNFLKVCCK